MVNLLADFVVRFNTGAKRHSECIFVPYSHTVIKIIRLLFRHNCISSFRIEMTPNSSFLRIKLIPLYVDSKSLIKSIELISRPGLRTY